MCSGCCTVKPHEWPTESLVPHRETYLPLLTISGGSIARNLFPFHHISSIDRFSINNALHEKLAPSFGVLDELKGGYIGQKDFQYLTKC